MKKLTLYLPNRLFDHLSTLPTFDVHHKRTMPAMLLSDELKAELEVLLKLNDLYCCYESKCAEQLAKDCAKRIDEIDKIAKENCKKKGIELVDVAGEKDHALKIPLDIEKV